jgi:hypothetical protein
VNRYSIYAGRFTITDYFDNNNYTHDPRMQFMAWGVMYNGSPCRKAVNAPPVLCGVAVQLF